MKTRTVTETWTCDRCGGSMTPRGYSYQRIRLQVDHEVYDALGNGAGGGRAVDLCDRCVPVFLAFLEGK